ncbi:hypothetical protein RHMOL_Rhmol02G0105800 [Rhododendron molle]|nr:hypothetical protein RHMOL_Rhmol02G0105800 [Rhododendron molle]
MRIRRVESRIRKRKQPSPAVMDLIRRARLEGLCSVPFLSLDWALITALVERWRPETHTFHMRPGELTITLQDVEILLGIPVDGRPVTGTTLIDHDDLFLRLLGEAPGERDKKGGKVKLKWLRDRFNGIVEDGAAAEVVARQARGYLLLLLGGTIFADFTGGFVHLSYLQLLENFDVAGEYSWGSGALSVLYRNLCHGAKIKSKQMTGPFVVVQIWAWERFPYLAPGRRGKRAPKPGAPLLGRWDDDFHSPDLATHVVGAYRHHLDIQRDDEVNWTPYSDEVVQSLPHYCRAGKAIWRATVPLIFYSFVEYHQPERVLRQFGFRQGIPPPSRAREWPHGKTLQSGQKDWAIEHSAAVKTWDERTQHVAEAVSPDLPVYQFDDPYVVWYERITRRCISRVGAGIDGAARCFKTFNRPEVPETYRAVGLAGLQHLSVLEKFLRLKPPDHHLFEQPATGNEELAQGREESSQQPESQHQATGHDEPLVEGSTCQTEPPDASQPPPSVPIGSPYPLLSSYVLSPSMFESPGIIPHANSSSSFQPEVSWDHLEVFDFSPGGTSYDSLVEAKRRRIGESNLGDVGVSLGDRVVTQDGESNLGDVGVSLGDGVVTQGGESNLGDVGVSLGDGVVTQDGESNVGDVGVSLGDGVVTQDAVADAQAEDVGIYLNVDEQNVSRETVTEKVTQAATTATPVAGQRKSTRHRKKTHCGTGGTHSSHVGRESISRLEQTVNLFLEIGRLSMSARYYKDMAELYENHFC